jgi:hypothetical protein
MSAPGSLKLSLKRGALVAAANWQVVLIQFIVDTLFKTLLAVPIVGGVILVGLVIGGNPGDLFRLEPSLIVPTLVGVLLAQPAALAAFLFALGVVVASGSILTFAVKAGSVAVLVEGESTAERIEEGPLRPESLDSARQWSIDLFISGVRSLFRRYLRLGLFLSLAYAIVGGAYVVFVFGPQISPWLDGPLVIGLASLMLVVAITAINFVYLLMQIVVAVENCAVHRAVPHVVRMYKQRTSEIMRIFGAILALMLVSMAGSILAVTALGLIAAIPFVGLVALPLQVAAWLVRGVVFQFVGLTEVATYVRVHRTLQETRHDQADLATVTSGTVVSGI